MPLSELSVSAETKSYSVEEIAAMPNVLPGTLAQP